MTDPVGITTSRPLPLIDRSDTDPGCRALRLSAQRQGVVCVDNLPFLLGPEDSESAVLLVHGFTATPWEMRLIGEDLARDGICSLAVRLPGHGTSARDLARRPWEEWQSAVREGYRLLESRHSKLYGLGMSTGCLLLLAHALEQSYQGLVLCAPYLKMRHRLAGHAGWLHWLLPYHGKQGSTEACRYYYDRRPVAGVHQINRLIRHLKPRLGDCKAPVLAFNSEGDRTIVSESGRDLLDRLGSRVRIHQRYGRDVPHILVRENNPVYQETFAMARAFINELSNPGDCLRPGTGKEKQPPSASVPADQNYQ